MRREDKLVERITYLTKIALAWGYNFYTKNGRNEFRFPSLEYGYCRSEQDAKLYILGLLLANGSLFTGDTLLAIGNTVKELQQLSLF